MHINNISDIQDPKALDKIYSLLFMMMFLGEYFSIN